MSRDTALTHSSLDGSRSDELVVLVPLSNPATQAHLVRLGVAIANQCGGRVIAITIVQVPDQTALETARDEFDVEAAESLLAEAKRSSPRSGVPIDTRTIFSHRQFAEIFDGARRYRADVCVMGWGPDSPGIPGRAEPLVDELAHTLPCDFLVFRDRGFDPSNVLLPTSGGPHTGLAATVARVFQAEFGSEVTLLHVSDDLDAGRSFLESWATEHDLTDVDVVVETGDIEAGIADAAREHTMILVGATETGVLCRLVGGSLVLDVLDDVECSVLLAEKRHERTLRERILGAGTKSRSNDEEGVTPASTGTGDETAGGRGRRG